mmetsp:Transcript_31027/g.83028  ORF Transcript_31027/g.83028 Transcript_31027/m.83028 type:complete len:482 (-) Transcript_31027:482-1927(-)
MKTTGTSRVRTGTVSHESMHQVTLLATEGEGRDCRHGGRTAPVHTGAVVKLPSCGVGLHRHGNSAPRCMLQQVREGLPAAGRRGATRSLLRVERIRLELQGLHQPDALVCGEGRLRRLRLHLRSLRARRLGLRRPHRLTDVRGDVRLPRRDRQLERGPVEARLRLLDAEVLVHAALLRQGLQRLQLCRLGGGSLRGQGLHQLQPGGLRRRRGRRRRRRPDFARGPSGVARLLHADVLRPAAAPPTAPLQGGRGARARKAVVLVQLADGLDRPAGGVAAAPLVQAHQDAVRDGRGRQPRAHQLCEQADPCGQVVRPHAAVHQGVVHELVGSQPDGLHALGHLKRLVQLASVAVPFEQGGESDQVRLDAAARRRHLAEQVFGRLDIAAPDAHVNDRVVRDPVAWHPLSLHLPEQGECPAEVLLHAVPFDQGGVENRVAVLLLALHVLEDLYRLLLTAALHACVDHAAVRHRVRLASLLGHLVP